MLLRRLGLGLGLEHATVCHGHPFVKVFGSALVPGEIFYFDGLQLGFAIVHAALSLTPFVKAAVSDDLLPLLIGNFFRLFAG
jgi:hypothetical protein